ncbi:MAG: TonB protein [Pseudomonas sp.]|nr:TonB protein [Pseudomonas sp.]
MLRFFACAFALFITASAIASEVELVPIFTPEPTYPEALLKNRYSGKVRVSMTIGAGGKVQSVTVIEGVHPELTQAVQQIIAQWRYKPWKGTVNAPAAITITLPIIFGPRGAKSFAGEINVGLGNVRCAYLNNEVIAARSDYPKEPLNRIDLFWYTREFLSSRYVALKMPAAGQRKALVNELQGAIPGVIKACRSNPEKLYGDYLPKQVRELLVGVATKEVFE